MTIEPPLKFNSKTGIAPCGYVGHFHQILPLL